MYFLCLCIYLFDGLIFTWFVVNGSSFTGCSNLLSMLIWPHLISYQSQNFWYHPVSWWLINYFLIIIKLDIESKNIFSISGKEYKWVKGKYLYDKSLWLWIRKWFLWLVNYNLIKSRWGFHIILITISWYHYSNFNDQETK